MLDKYKPARVQRLVPWRSPRTARATSLVLRDLEFRMATILATSQRDSVQRVARTLLHSIAAEAAFESGALPGEFLPKELRVDWG